MGVTVDGVSLDRLVWNVRTIGDRLITAGRRGGNTPAATVDGTIWRADKPLSELYPSLSMWLAGADPDGDFPAVPRMVARMRLRLDELLTLLVGQDRLREIVDTDTGRRCFAEVTDVLAPRTMAGGARAEVVVPLVVPAGCWEDVTAFDTGAVVLPAAGSVTVTGAGGGHLPTTGLTIELTPPGRNIELTTADGRWIKFNGDLPAGAATRIHLDPLDPRCYQISAPGVSLIAAVVLPDVVPLPLPNSAADPVLDVTAEAVTGASRIRVQGRRRWLSA